MDEQLDEAREWFAKRHWSAARAALSAADTVVALDHADLERWAIAAYLAGYDDETDDAWSRAHRSHLAAGDPGAAARCAFWSGATHLLRGQIAPTRGWFARVRSIAEDQAVDSVAAAYASAGTAIEALFSGELVAAESAFDRAAQNADRLGDADGAAMSRLGRGQALIGLGRVDDGIGMLDEAMVAVTAGETGPIATGLIYCAVIESCRDLFDTRRAHEWTEALTHWCAEQPDLVPYRGQCLVHRAELLQFRGSWSESLIAGELACQRLSDPPHPAAGSALYQRADVHRHRGEYRAAGELYQGACERGHSGQPGLALLWLAQGRTAPAAAAIERMLTEETGRPTRALLLQAAIDVDIAAGDIAAAQAQGDELAELSEQFGAPPVLAAMVEEARGTVLLAAGDPHPALRHLRIAWTRWRELEAPYETARARVKIAVACRGLGDIDSAAIELDAARKVFVELGATPDVEHVDRLMDESRPRRRGMLTARETEVLESIAAGRSNRAIAEELVISEKTVARHVSNIFTKLGVTTRAAATAYAYEHALVTASGKVP